MARKPLSTIDWMQKSVDDIFAAPLKEMESSGSPHVNVHEKIEQFEQKSRLNFHKSRHAPPPPGTQIMLPKIGNYTPKILLSRENTKHVAPKAPSENVQITNNYQSNSTERKPLHEQPQSLEHSSSIKRTHDNSKCNIETDEGGIYSTIDMMPDYDDVKPKKEERKCMIIGDKDTPLVLESSYIGDEDEIKKESQISETKVNVESNVEFENKLSFDENNVVNLGEVVVNPLFEGKGDQAKDNDADISTDTPRHPYKKRRAPGVPPSYINRHRHNSQNSHDSDEEYPYIPEPDYEEEEATMNFENVSQKETTLVHRQNQPIIKEYEGEDFSKYLDDDEGFEDTTFTWRKNIHHQRKTSKQPPIPKTKHTNRSNVSAPKLKPIKKQKTSAQHGSMNRQTLRTISYADCKMGVDDRTVRSVKSTSAGGRYIKRGKERTMIIDGDTGEGGYEEFLRMRHKEDGSMESNSSGDSGHETADEFNHNHFFNMQPKQLKDNHDKGTFWQKLTWRFKRHAYRMT